MKILAFDTSTETRAVALSDGETLFTDYQTGGRDVNVRLHLAIAAVLRAANLKLKDLDAIAYGRGPGAFIGLRIAAATAQAIACASGRPLLALSSIAMVAQTAFDASDIRRVLAVLNARKGEWYYGYYRRGDDGAALAQSEEGLDTFENILCEPNVARDSGGVCWSARAPAPDTPSLVAHYAGDAFPDADVLLRLAKHQAASDAWVEPSRAHPIYLRDKVVG